ncbi:MAG: hypothetical protein K8F25_05270 [Fimbriimonadaceae bacterium]|nr:hypothetical protein [Alphaproteobacteria bacterium]
MDASENLVVRIAADTRPIETSFNNVNDLARNFGSAITRAFSGAVIGGKSFRETLRSLGQSFSRMALSAATKPLEGLLSQGLGSLFKTLPFARGGVIGNSMPVPFARGGVISSPTYFPLGNRQTGLAGEAGAEAILPLRRGSDGRLGVATAGGGGQTIINFNVTAQDAESFRRSESQVAAMVQRAVSRGQRNL